MAEVGQIWLDYTIENNPTGVAKILADYGYIGFMAPQSHEDLYAMAYEVIQNYGDDGVISLLKAHPEYEAFKELFTGNKTIGYKNAISDVKTRIEGFVKNLSALDQILVAMGVFLASYYFISQIKE